MITWAPIYRGHTGVLARRVGQRDEDRRRPALGADVLPDGGLAAGEAVLRHQTVVDAAGGVALLGRPMGILRQPLLNPVDERPKDWLGPGLLQHVPGRSSARQRRPPVVMPLAGDPADTLPVQEVSPADLFAHVHREHSLSLRSSEDCPQRTGALAQVGVLRPSRPLALGGCCTSSHTCFKMTENHPLSLQKSDSTMHNVTVLIPTYNHGSVLIYQIESLLKQTSPPVHIIILDDGSTDETQEMLKRYQQNETVKVLLQKNNIGVHAATNLLLDQVVTEFFAFAAADDILTSNWCMTTASLLETYKDAKMAISNSFIFENNQISLTDSIIALNSKDEGVYEPSQYTKLLMRYGKFPPSNTILYRSDIIEELVRPIFLKEELRSLIDILLILAIATRYPIAYSTKPTGVSVKNLQSYGNSFFSNDHLEHLVTDINLFAKRDKYILCDQLLIFVMRHVKYTWSKQIIANELRANKIKHRGVQYFPRALFYYSKLLTLFLLYKRFMFMKLHRVNTNVLNHKLVNCLDRSLFKRFDAACAKRVL
jgi:glycosyltransferase involved in cell wall biosynthesis